MLLTDVCVVVLLQSWFQHGGSWDWGDPPAVCLLARSAVRHQHNNRTLYPTVYTLTQEQTAFHEAVDLHSRPFRQTYCDSASRPIPAHPSPSYGNRKCSPIERLHTFWSVHMIRSTHILSRLLSQVFLLKLTNVCYRHDIKYKKTEGLGVSMRTVLWVGRGGVKWQEAAFLPVVATS